MAEEVNVHVFPKGEKTETLICNWCGEPHKVEAAYKEEIIRRGQERLDEVAALDDPEAKKQAALMDPDETWTCGNCYLFLMFGRVSDIVQTECHDHKVPDTRQYRMRKEKTE